MHLEGSGLLPEIIDLTAALISNKKKTLEEEWNVDLVLMDTTTSALAVIPKACAWRRASMSVSVSTTFLLGLQVDLSCW